MSKDEVRVALAVLDVRARLALRMAVFDGMRPGEILAIQFGRLRADWVVIDRRLYRNHLDTPKGRKGKNATRTVALSRDVGGSPCLAFDASRRERRRVSLPL